MTKSELLIALQNTTRTTSLSISRIYVQMLILFAAYILSNVFRTLPAVLAPGIAQEYGLSIQSVGYFLAAFNFAFGGMQLFVGVTIDRYGSMRTIAWLSLFTCLGSAMSWFATSFEMLIVSQVFIGIGCSAIFLGCLVFISKHFPLQKFASLSGLALGIGGCGMLLTATPLALVVEAWSWRGAFCIICLATILVTAACFFLSNEDDALPNNATETIRASFQMLGSLLVNRGTLAILLMGGVGYAAMITVRGFWIVPLLSERHGLSLIESGNIVLLLSVGMTLSPFLYGLIDPGGIRRRYLIVASAIAMSAAIILLGASYSHSLVPTVIAVGLIGAVSGFTILQYADVRSSFEPAVIGRALSLLNMSVFIGAAIVQMVVGYVGEKAVLVGMNSVECVFLTLGMVVIAGSVAFWVLPTPRQIR
jgi:predicted MFS family arabinose efflux permease